MLVLLKNRLNYIKDSIFERFFKEYNKLFFFFFSEHKMMKSLILEDENIIRDIRNLFRLKNEINYTAIKDIRNLFRLKKRN